MMFMFLLVLDSVGISVKSSGCKAQADTDYLGELDISVFYFLPVLSGVDCTCCIAWALGAWALVVAANRSRAQAL